MNATTFAAQRLRELRATAELPQRTIAEAMRAHGHGWSRATVSELERGTRRLHIDELDALAEVLGVLREHLLPEPTVRLEVVMDLTDTDVELDSIDASPAEYASALSYMDVASRHRERRQLEIRNEQVDLLKNEAIWSTK